MGAPMKDLQFKHKLPDTVEQYKQAYAQNLSQLKDKLITEAENKVVTYLTSKYGTVKLARSSKSKLDHRAGKKDGIVLDGIITVFTELSAAKAAKNLSMDVKVVHNTLSLPKYKFIDHIVADTKTAEQLQSALASTLTTTDADLEVNLADFGLTASDSVVEVYHPVYGGLVGLITKQEFDSLDTTPIFSKGTKGIFAADHPQAVLANKEFIITDINGDNLKLKIGNTEGWIEASQLPTPNVLNTTSTPTLANGVQVVITSALQEYYGDTITVQDIVNKRGTIANISEDHISIQVDNVCEQVQLPLTSAQVLQIVPNTMATPFRSKLEAVLRTMVIDKLADTCPNIRFIGQFTVPTLSQQPTRVTATKATLEVEDSSMRNDLTFKRASSYDQFMAFEMQKVASKKQSLVDKISSELAAVLSTYFSPAKILSTTSELDYEYEVGHKGHMVAQVELMDTSGPKHLSLTIPVQAGQATLPTRDQLLNLLKEAKSEKQKMLDQLNKEAEVNIAKVDAETAYQTSLVTSAMDPVGVSTPVVQKVAQNYNSLSSTDTKETIAINKVFFPESLQVGAVIDLGDGLKYKLVSKTVGQLSKGPADGSQWMFERLRPVGDGDPVYRINNY